jgi:hypothetical protein
MLRPFSLAALVIMSLVHNGGGPVDAGQAGGVASELSQIEQRLVKAWIDGDREMVGSVLAADWSVIDLTGRVLTKAQVMKEFGSGDRRIESGSVDDLNVRVFGDVAIVTGRSMLTGRERRLA